MEKETEKEVCEKNKIYLKKQKEKRIYIILAAIVSIYCFFFLSSFILPQKTTSAEDVTVIGKEINFAENRTVTLVRADYSGEQKMMEIVLYFTNQNYDNVNSYYYAFSLTGASTKGLVVDEVFNEELFTVLRIKDLPKDYGEMTLYFAPKTVEESQITDEITGTVILNQYNVEKKSIDLNKSRRDYLIERLELVIGEYKTTLERQTKKLEDLQTTAAALETENKEIKENKLYMTDYEIQQREQTIIENEDMLVEVKEEIKLQEEKVKATRAEIKAAENKKNKLKW